MACKKAYFPEKLQAVTIEIYQIIMLNVQDNNYRRIIAVEVR
jgi:hypothetical protein